MAWTPRQIQFPATRRAQNLALISRALTVFAVIGGLFLLAISRSDSERFAPLRGAVDDFVAPVWSTLRVPFDEVAAAFHAVGDYFGAVERNRQLEARLRDRAALIEQRDGLRRENRQLRQLLRVPTRPTSRVGVFAIGGASAGGMVRSALIAGGRKQGVAVGQPVRAAKGLVGRTIEVGDTSARVLLLTDPGSRVPVRVVRSGAAALVAGVGLPMLEVRYTAAGNGALKVGDRLVTSGDGGIFPPDVPVGIVTRIEGEVPLVAPLAPAHALGFVLVERPYLLPPAPPPPSRPQAQGAARP